MTDPISSALHRVTRLVPAFLLTALVPLLAGCVQPSVRPIVGPSGDPTLFISCSDTGQCYQLAGQSCPNGYDIQRARGAAVESYLVHCKAPAAEQPVYYAAQPAYSPPPQRQAWAPSPAAQPWAQSAPPPPPAPDAAQTTASGAPNAMSMPRPIGSSEFDLGY